MDKEGDIQGLLRLMTWLSPAFPTGAFAYSTGLEQAVADGLVGDAEALGAWIRAVIVHGSGWNDAVLFAESYRCHGDSDRLAAVAELAEALSGSRERHMETMLLGDAFLAAVRAWPDPLFDRIPARLAYPVAVGAVAGAHRIDLEQALAGFLQAASSQFVSAGIRLSVAGQRQGVAIIACLENDVGQTAARAAVSSLDDLGSSTFGAEIAALRHETQVSRLFRS
ncbi:urease accessory protein UreF [Rhizobiaceae bacterium n13]|uniref:Urease accessory protein UreF n=1 Tax=Ferirhizobium litorale TaxID=2927786 RepID=A0AAE3QCR5_9HYPH|nr:urease accessory protein UreF [Fererhizobium litorale]MDI7860676.1 urease accessory protein UreF [Fererhizobium litorale]MDI7920824.1 urease accessory protein UreF [Fererhizobium litorale]